MANHGGKVLRASTVKKARDRAQKEQFVVVGKWPPPKPVMSKKEAEFYGEDMGWLAKLANSGRRRPSRRPDFEKLILEWAKESGQPITIYQLPPNATRETWASARDWCRKAEAAGELALIVVGT